MQKSYQIAFGTRIFLLMTLLNKNSFVSEYIRLIQFIPIVKREPYKFGFNGDIQFPLSVWNAPLRERKAEERQDK